MNYKKRVLVFPSSNEVGCEVLRCLSSDKDYEILPSVSDENTASESGCIYIENVYSCDFAGSLLAAIVDYDIDLFIPCHDEVIYHVGELRKLRSWPQSCIAVASSDFACLTTRSKRSTYEVLAMTGLTPRLFNLHDPNIPYPVFCKPDRGQGSKNTKTCSSYNELLSYSKMWGENEFVICEFLPGPEFTIDCFTTKAGEVIFAQTRSRDKISSGIATSSTVLEDIIPVHKVTEISDILKMRGAWFIQIKIDCNNQPKLLEVGSRIAGSSGITRASGVNLIQLSLFDALGDAVSIGPRIPVQNNVRKLSEKFSFSLSYKKLYVDLDDTLIVDGNLNVYILHFVFQCISNKIPVALITRHRGRLYDVLRSHRLLELFDEIYWLRRGERKSCFIDGSDSLLIDDSFAERKEVADHAGCYVVSVQQATALLGRE